MQSFLLFYLRVAELLREELLLPLRLELLDELLPRELDTDELFDELLLLELDTELLLDEVLLLVLRFVSLVTRTFEVLLLRFELEAVLFLAEVTSLLLPLRLELPAELLLNEALLLERIELELEASTTCREELLPRREEASEATTVRLFSSEFTLTTRLSFSREGTFTKPPLRS